jgi:nitrous oxide reductase
MKSTISRRNFLQSGALVAACAAGGALPAVAEAVPVATLPARR